MESMKQRVGIYARVSSQEQATEGVSMEAQTAALKAYAKGQGWEIAGEYPDGGYSGGTDDRPAFQRMLMDARHKRLDIIAVCKLDRFFRNLRLLLNYLHEMEQLGIKFVSTQEGLDTSTPYGKFAVQIMGIIAEFERGRIGERVKDSRHLILSKGEWPGGSTLYGYRWHRPDRKWQIVPEEADVIRRVYDFYLKDNLGMVAITGKLNGEGRLSRAGIPWRVNRVRQLLTHPAYMGSHPVGIKVPPIVDETTWQKAQHKRESARSVQKAPKGWLLQGIVFCGKCGHALKCLKKRPNLPGYYACRGRVEKKYKSAGEACTLPYLRADKLEWAVWKRVKAVLNEPDKLLESVNQSLRDLEVSKSQFSVELLDLDKKIEGLKTKAERLGMAFTDGMIPENIYKAKSVQFKKQIDSLLERRNNISPSELTELAVLEDKIALVKEIIEKGRLSVTEFGLFASHDDCYTPVGFNAWRETDGKMAIGEVWEIDSFGIEGTDHKMRGIDAPPEFWETDPEERSRRIKQNMRAILQFFNIKVFVYPDHVEIRGTIPTQVLTGEEPQPSEPSYVVPIIKSARGSGGWACTSFIPKISSIFPRVFSTQQYTYLPAVTLILAAQDHPFFGEEPGEKTGDGGQQRSDRQIN